MLPDIIIMRVGNIAIAADKRPI